MLFIGIVIGFIVIGVLLMLFSIEFDQLGSVITALSVFILLFMLILVGVNHMTIDADKSKMEQEYKALMYKVQSVDMRDELNINTIEVINEVQEWNENLAYYQKLQKDKWLGVFVPNIYDDFEFIEYNSIVIE